MKISMHMMILLSCYLIQAAHSIDLQRVLTADTSCCPNHVGSQQDCEAETFSDCVWLDANDPVVLDTPSHSQCLDKAHVECERHLLANPGGCCGGCCGCTPAPGPASAPAPPSPPATAPAPPQCTPSSYPPQAPGTTAGTGTGTTAGSGGSAPINGPPGSAPAPEPVNNEQTVPNEDQWEAIAEDEVDGCSTPPNQQSCFETDGTDYTTATYTFLGVTASGSDCCYKYKSVKSDRKDCKGKNPDQSHIQMSIDCDEDEYTITSGDGKKSYPDPTVCYDGIKIDKGCSGTCEYEVCISYANLEDGECPYVESWIIDKAGPAYSYAYLNGMPSCNADYAKRKRKEFYVEMENGLMAKYGVSGQTIGILLFVVSILAGLLYRYYLKNDKAVKLIDNKQQYNTFQTNQL